MSDRRRGPVWTSVDPAYQKLRSGWQGFDPIGREIASNALDERACHGADVTFAYARGKIVVETIGRVPSMRDLAVLGSGDKTDGTAIGRNAEGWLLASLVAAREGRVIKFHVGDQTWTPFIGEHPNLGGQVLGFKVRKRRGDPIKGVRTEIEATREEWNTLRERCLPIDEPDGSTGLLTDPRFRGQLFVGGIWVADLVGTRGLFGDLDARWGYNFDPSRISLNRDRAMPDTHDVRWALTELLSAQVQLGELSAADLLAAASESNTLEATVLGEVWRWSSSTRETQEEIAKLWLEAAGDTAVPVTSQDEYTKLSHVAGLTPVLTTAAIKAVVEVQLGSVEERYNKALTEPTKIYSLDELSSSESEIVVAGKMILDKYVKEKVGPWPTVEIVDFPEESEVLGLYDYKSGGIRIARKRLDSFESYFATLIHEIAHAVTSDNGSHDRVMSDVAGSAMAVLAKMAGLLS
jgi:hypothetical protein